MRAKQKREERRAVEYKKKPRCVLFHSVSRKCCLVLFVNAKEEITKTNQEKETNLILFLLLLPSFSSVFYCLLFTNRIDAFLGD